MVQLNLPTKIITDRLLIQPLKYEDAEEIFYGYASKPEATRFVAWPTHKSIADTRNFLRYVISAWKIGTEYAYSIRSLESGRLVGSFGVVNDNGKLQFGYILNPSQWGNGYATEVCKAMMKLLRLQYGVYRIQSFVDVENTMSANVLVKCGLVEEARLPNWFRFVNQGDTPKDCILFRLPEEQLPVRVA